jgi:hypothetical protein
MTLVAGLPEIVGGEGGGGEGGVVTVMLKAGSDALNVPSLTQITMLE